MAGTIVAGLFAPIESQRAWRLHTTVYKRRSYGTARRRSGNYRDPWASSHAVRKPAALLRRLCPSVFHIEPNSIIREQAQGLKEMVAEALLIRLNSFF
jgi:hypothetical protein